jgi:hypothetical protein
MNMDSNAPSHQQAASSEAETHERQRLATKAPSSLFSYTNQTGRPVRHSRLGQSPGGANPQPGFVPFSARFASPPHHSIGSPFPVFGRYTHRVAVHPVGYREESGGFVLDSSIPVLNKTAIWAASRSFKKKGRRSRFLLESCAARRSAAVKPGKACAEAESPGREEIF